MLNPELNKLLGDLGACLDEGYSEIAGEKLGEFLRGLRDQQPGQLARFIASLDGADA